MITIRNIALGDLEKYEYWKLPFHEYHRYNGPYYKKSSSEEVKEQIEKLRTNLLGSGESYLKDLNFRIITNESKEILGEVSWYWRSKETSWLEVGLVIFNNENWGKGIGYSALKIWITRIFEIRPELVRIGLTTWSGNHGMIHLAVKMGLHKEAEFKKARIVDGKYYDSVSYGILKEE